MVTEFVESSTETRIGFGAFEAAHRSVTAEVDPIGWTGRWFCSILLFRYRLIRCFTPSLSSILIARITVVTVRRDTRGGDAGHGFGGAEKRLGRLHVAGFAQPDIDERTETINGAIKIAPATVHVDVRLIGVPAFSNPALAPPPKAVDQGGRELGAEGPSVRKRTLAYCTQCRWVALAALRPRVLRARAKAAVCIARNVIPRVRPPVCCVQYGTSKPDTACNVYCTP